jgi:hypothetical protein
MLKQFIFLCIFFTAPFAQEANFSATADKTSATIGEQITITAQLVCAKKPGSISSPQLHSTADFDVLSTNQNQSSSTSIEVVNGKMTQNVTMTYLFYFTIAPKKTGSFTVPALQVNVDGAQYASNPFEINVGKEQVQATEVKVSLSLGKRNIYSSGSSRCSPSRSPRKRVRRYSLLSRDSHSFTTGSRRHLARISRWRGCFRSSPARARIRRLAAKTGLS